MSYQTVSFLLFSLAVLVVYYICPKRLQKYVLLIGSIIFYCLAGTQYLPYLLTTLVVSFLSGLWMGKIYQKADGRLAAAKDMPEKKAIRERAKKHAKIVLNLSMLVPIALLVVCKYSSFLILRHLRPAGRAWPCGPGTAAILHILRGCSVSGPRP